jgi:c-di-GMP-binding flagellar brake protein YcgR
LHERHVRVGSHAGEAFPLAVKAARVSDARAHRRLDAVMLVAYSIGEEFAPARSEAYDLGQGGLAMLSTGELAPGSQLTLELELRGEPRPPLHLTGEVRWCRHDPLLGKYRVGVEFTNRTPEQGRQLLGYIDTMYKLRDLGIT